MARGALGWTLACVFAWLAGCAAAPVPPTPPDPAPQAPQPAAGSAADDPRERFEQQQREAAAAAAQQGRWAEALWAWDLVLLLRPDDGDAADQRAQAAAAAREALRQHLARAAAARRRGDLAGAARAYLQALAVAPDHAEAAQALRDIERERAQRLPGSFAPRPPVR